MLISHRLPTAYGRALVAHPRRPVIPAKPAAALLFANEIDNQASICLAEGRFSQAERLSHLALEARCRATGDRA